MYRCSQLPLALTSGEPAGIGPDICIALLQNPPCYPVEILIDRKLLAARAQQLGCESYYQQALRGKIANVYLRHIPTVVPVTAGVLAVDNAAYVIALIDCAVDRLNSGHYAGIVTAPVHKEIINQAGICFKGHTEYLQQKAGVARVVMMFADEHFKIALATTHLPLREVPSTITEALIFEIVQVIDTDLRTKWHMPSPKIAITGLNPHAGEGGYLGNEENEILLPVISRLQAAGIAIEGPYSADTVFQEKILSQYDLILAMYHDQVLPVVKYASFFKAVNITLGLPYVRTSVDHGTALSLAGTGCANAGSLQAAIKVAAQMVST